MGKEDKFVFTTQNSESSASLCHHFKSVWKISVKEPRVKRMVTKKRSQRMPRATTPKFSLKS